EQSPAEDNTSEEPSAPPKSTAASKAHHHAAAETASQRAPAEEDVSKLDIEETNQPFDRSVPAPSTLPNHSPASHATPHPATPVPAAQRAAPAAPVAPSDHLTVRPNPVISSGQPALQASAQPTAPASAQANDSEASRWPLVPSAAPAQPAAGAVQVAAEASN